jgi:hypothetical protein
MGEEKDELGIMEDFEWALKDPTEEKIRELGEVVSIITGKLIDAIGKLEKRLEDMESDIGGLSSQVSSLSSRIASGGVAASPAASAASDIASAPIASAPKPKPAGGAPSGPTMMGELKALLAARRKKADGSTESE